LEGKSQEVNYRGRNPKHFVRGGKNKIAGSRSGNTFKKWVPWFLRIDTEKGGAGTSKKGMGKE